MIRLVVVAITALTFLTSAYPDDSVRTWEREINAGGSIVPAPCCFEEFPPLDRFTDGDFERLVATYRLAKVALDSLRSLLGVEAADVIFVGLLAEALGLTVDDFGSTATVHVATIRSCEFASGYPRILCARIVESAGYR